MKPEKGFASFVQFEYEFKLLSATNFRHENSAMIVCIPIFVLKMQS